MRSLAILDSTLREGEQFSGAYFSLEQRLTIAHRLSEIGVEYIELPSPGASPETRTAIEQICALNLRSQILTHVRCVAEDVQAALETPVDGINLFYGTSHELRSYSHGRQVDRIIEEAIPLIQQIRAAGRYVRFSAEDAFRSDLVDLLTVFDAVVAAGVQRIGLPDTVGIATPRQVEQTIGLFKRRYPQIGIEFHGHNDTGCAIANTVAAMESGADCLDTTILGIGERNGITSLSGLIAQLYIHYPERLASYHLPGIVGLDQYVAGCLNLAIPFNSPISAPNAFTHRAGIHTKAVLNHPGSYEILDPDDFGLQRHVDLGSRYTGRHAVAQRVSVLGLEAVGEEVQLLTSALKAQAEQRSLNQQEVDEFIQSWYHQRRSLQWER